VEENLHQEAQENVYTEEKAEEHFLDQWQYRPNKVRFLPEVLQL